MIIWIKYEGVEDLEEFLKKHEDHVHTCQELLKEAGFRSGSLWRGHQEPDILYGRSEWDNDRQKYFAVWQTPEGDKALLDAKRLPCRVRTVLNVPPAGFTPPSPVFQIWPPLGE